METVPSNATAKQLKHPNHSDSGGNTWQSNKFGYTDIYALSKIKSNNIIFILHAVYVASWHIIIILNQFVFCIFIKACMHTLLTKCHHLNYKDPSFLSSKLRSSLKSLVYKTIN
jgi:hypothetical protein